MKDLGITRIEDADSLQLISIGASLYTMNLNDSQLEQIQKGAQKFSDDFPKIMKWLKTNAPGSNIIVSTIYNPIPNLLSFYDTSEQLLKKMNSVITDGAAKGGYYVADVYKTFVNEQKNDTQILNLNIGQYMTSPISLDIHPNAVGHKLIAKIHNEIFNKIPSIVKTNSGLPVTSKILLSGTVNKNGVLSVDITKKLLNSVINKAQDQVKLSGRKKDGIAVVLENSNTGVKSLKVKLDADAIDLLKSTGIKKITVNTDIIHISLNKEAIKKIALKTKGKVTISADKISKLSKTAKNLIGSRPVYLISIKDTSGNKITDLGTGKLSLSIRYKAEVKENIKNLFTVSVNSKGRTNILKGSDYKDGWVSYTSSILSIFGVGYKK